MIKVHNVISLNKVLQKENSSIFSIGSVNNKSHIPYLICGELFLNEIHLDELKSLFPEEKEQITFTYSLEGNLELIKPEGNKLFINKGDLYISKSSSENSIYDYKYNIISPSVRLVQLRFPLSYNIQIDSNYKIIHESNMPNYKDPTKNYIKLFSYFPDKDEGSFFLWYISIVPGGRMHIPIPIEGKSFAFIIEGQAQLENHSKIINNKNIVSMESLKKGNELNILNTSGASKLNIILLGGSSN